MVHFVGRHPPPGKRQACQHHDEQWRQDATGTPLKEVEERKGSILQFQNDDGGDEIAADYEEDIYANKTTRKYLESGMEKNDRHDSHSP